MRYSFSVISYNEAMKMTLMDSVVNEAIISNRFGLPSFPHQLWV